MESSVVWQFFKICESDESIAQCLISNCNKKYSRGKTPKTYSTKSLRDHLQQKHSALFQEANEKREIEKKKNTDEVSLYDRNCR